MGTKEDYIAVFDSGVGGISVLRHLVRVLPGERFLYFGDSANAPYGSRSTEEVRQLTLDGAAYLLDNYPLKALQDLNVCGTVADVTPLTQLTWLDNLWAAERGYDAKRILLEAFPQEDEVDEEGNVIVPKSDVYLYIYGGSTRAWRHLPHYYEMRDMLGMYYMDQ